MAKGKAYRVDCRTFGSPSYLVGHYDTEDQAKAVADSHSSGSSVPIEVTVTSVTVDDTVAVIEATKKGGV